MEIIWEERAATEGAPFKSPTKSSPCGTNEMVNK
jgi:hypothetical protein